MKIEKNGKSRNVWNTYVELNRLVESEFIEVIIDKEITSVSVGETEKIDTFEIKGIEKKECEKILAILDRYSNREYNLSLINSDIDSLEKECQLRENCKVLFLFSNENATVFAVIS